MNKKNILIFIALLGTVTLKAQTQKGDQLLGGYIGFITGKGTSNYIDNSYNDNSVFKTNGISIGPSYSYFIGNNLDLGATLDYSNQKTGYSYINGNLGQNDDIIQGKSFTLTGSVYLRKYFFFSNKFGIRTGPFISLQKFQSDQNYIQPIYNYFTHDYNYSAGINADLVFFLSKRFGFATTLGSLAYNHDANKQPNYQNTANSFSLNLISNGLSISAYYCFEK